MALFLILQRIEPFTAGFSFEPFTASFRRRWLFFSYSRTSTIFVIFVPKKMLFHLIPFIYGTSENRTFRPQNGFFFSIYALMEKYRKWFLFSIYALMEQYRFRRLFQTNTRRQTSPPATATVSVHSQRQTESPTSPKSGSMLAPHFELNELDARVTPWSYTLVIGCIETNICTKICVGKLSPRTTLCSPLHRS